MASLVIVVRVILIAIGVLAFLWNTVGLPIGMVWGAVYLIDSKSKKKFNKRRWFWVTFGGMITLFGVFSLYALVATVAAILGYRL